MKAIKTPLLALACATVAPLWMAPGDIGCAGCDVKVRAIEVGEETAWHEFDVLKGKRQFLLVVALEGETKAELVAFDKKASLQNVRCERDASQTLCEFTPGADGQVGVAVEAVGGEAEALIEVGTVDQ